MRGVHAKVGGIQCAQPLVCDLFVGMEIEDKVQPFVGTYTNHLLGANMQYLTDPWRATSILGEYGCEGRGAYIVGS